jgi:hypothetical protein
MTIARRSLEDGAAPESGDAPTPDHPVPGLAAARPSRAHEQPNVPIWALAAGMVLVLMFAGLVVQTFSGRSLLSRLAALVPGSRVEHVTDADRSRILYVPGATVQEGQIGIGARGQDRAFQAGDAVLLGATSRLVRLEEGGRLTELRAPEGTSLQVTSLGPWDPAAGSLAGLTARYAGDAWTVEAPQLQSVGASLHVPGAPEEELTLGFQLMPPGAGRMRRFETAAGSTVRIRPTGRVPSLVIEGLDPLPTLDNVTVTVQATVRASEGATLELALNDVVDAAGTVQKTADRRGATNEDEWLILRAQRRVLYGSPNDRYSVGLLEVRNRDWLEVRDLGVYLGVLP